MSIYKLEHLGIREQSWNPVTGCTPADPAPCGRCWARSMHERFNGPGTFAKVATHPDRLVLPAKWKKPRLIPVCFMGDLFHEDVPDSFIWKVIRVMQAAEQHIFLVLTKRPDRMVDILCDVAASLVPHVWWGFSAWNQGSFDNGIWLTRYTNMLGFNWWVSLEPLLGAVGFVYPGPISWIIVGGQSGTGTTPVHPDWVRILRHDCESLNISFLFKQWGGNVKGRRINGRLYERVPAAIIEHLVPGAECKP